MTSSTAAKSDTDQGPSAESAEGRHHLRHAYSGRVFHFDDRGSEFATLDLSVGGVGVLSSKPLPAGEPVQLGLLDSSIVVDGHVRHIRQVDQQTWRLGIAFRQEEPELAQAVLGA